MRNSKITLHRNLILSNGHTEGERGRKCIGKGFGVENESISGLISLVVGNGGGGEEVERKE